MEKKREQIQSIYDKFAAEAAPHKTAVACEKGCAFCCTDAGNIDITTLEGLVIRDKIRGLPRPRQATLKKAVASDIRKRERGQSSACPFLLKTRACGIYDVRPFACRRIYSVHTCSRSKPPMLNRTVMELAGQTIAELQRLDETGYSGHISYILHMLESPRFLATYLAGDHKPGEIVAFGKSHHIIINKMVV